MGRSSVFSLEQIYRKQVTQTWSKIPEVFRYVNEVVSTVNPYGYARNGSNSGIDRIDFNNDTVTASAKGSMATGITETELNSNFGNLNYGYITGGKGSGPAPQPSNWATTSISRIDYSNDATAASPKGPYSTPVYNHGGVGNNDYGYSIAGQDFGYPPPAIRYSTIVRMDYSNDTVSPPAKSNYPYEGSGNFGLSGTGNMDYGWIANGANNSIVHRIDYANDTVSPPSRTYLDRFGVNGRKCTGNAFYGYWQGGFTQTKFSRVDFSNDTATGVTKGSSFQGYKNGSVTSKDYAYLYGNYYPYSSLVERMDYSNDDIAAAPKGPLSVTNGGGKHAAGVSAQQFGLPTVPVPATRTENYPAGFPFGYTSGGIDDSPATISSVERIDFSSSTLTPLLKGPLPVAKYSHAGTGNLTHGYHGGGYTSGNSSTVDRIDYANDSPTASPKGNLAFAGSNSTNAAVGNVSYGYWNEGQASPSTRVSRVDFSNDSAVASPKGNLVTGGLRSSATGTQSYGYFCNSVSTTSNPSPTTSTSERIDYSNDTATALQRANSSFDQYGRAAAGNSNYGYWFGGTPHDFSEPWTTNVDRLDYSSDTTTMSPKGNLYTIATRNAATSDANHGYIMGRGMSPATNIQQYDFGNDTSTALNKAQMNQNRGYNAASASHANANPSTTANTIDKGADGYVLAGSLGPAYGYFSGGYNPSNSPAHPSTTYYSNVDRVDFASDTSTASPRGKLDQARSNAGAAGSLSHGYIGSSDLTSGYTSIVARVDYANDSATAVVKGSMDPDSDRYQSATSNASYAWFAGGQPSGTNSKVQRIDFNNDTATASPRGNLTLARQALAGAGNADYGWHAGGYGWPAPDYIRSVVDRIDYSNDSVTATPKGNLSVKRDQLSGTGNASYGYYSGGYNVVPGGNNWVSNIDRIDYSNDTPTATPKGNLSQSRSRGSATGNQSYGYAVGGEGNNDNGLSTVDRIDFANDTATAAIKGPLNYSARGYSGFSAQADALQGTPTFIPRIRWVDSVAEGPDITEGPAYGYIGGGYNPSVAALTTVLRIDYANDTATLASHTTFPGPSTSRSKYQHFAVSSTTHSYFGGGKNGGGNQTSDIYRLDLANDTATAGTPGGELSSGGGYVFMCTATGNHSYGYVGGGASPIRSTINRIDYSNDAIAAPSKGPLSYTRQYAGATGTQSYGYWGGSAPSGKSTVDRVDYSNDTATATRKGDLTSSRYYQSGAAGNLSYGYWAGGAYAPGDVSTIDRVDYSNDTATASPKGPLSAAKWYMGATSNLDYGYWTGGRTEPSSTGTSIIERLDFASDTTTASPKGNMDNVKHSTASTSARANGMPTANPPIAAPVQPPFPFPVQLPAPPAPGGYNVGGYNMVTPSGPRSFVDRIDFAIDGTVASPKGNLTNGAYSAAATGNLSYGWVKLGRTPSTIKTSLIDRIDFSNDTATASPRTPLSSSAYFSSATGNVDYGYYCGGSDSNPRESTVNRVDFSDDTATATKGPLSQAKYQTSSTGTQSYGYVAGGGTGGPPWVHGISIVDRIDYSSDTSTASPKGNLVNARYAMGATSNTSYGWWSGGRASPGGNYSSTDRLDFSSDTTTMTPKGPLTSSRYALAGTGNSSYGFMMGGGPSPAAVSHVSRIDYSNDTATAPNKGFLPQVIKLQGAVSATDNANPQ